MTPWTCSMPRFPVLEFVQIHIHESMIPSNHLILCCPFLPKSSVFPSIRSFPMSWLCIRWPKCWSFSFNISSSTEYSRFISFRIGWLDLLAVQGLSRVFSRTTVQKHQWSLFFECWVLSQLFHSPLSPSSSGSLVLHFLQLGWCHLHVWGYWYFSWQSWFQLVLYSDQHFTRCTLHRS